MNYANPFSLSSHGSFLNPKDNPSILSSFLSQNQSIRSAQSIPSKLNYIPHKKSKKKELISPRSKFMTLHENRQLEKRSVERVKYVSVHSTAPYLYISKKNPQIPTPTFPKLSPEPKIEVQRMPYINIMTEPTATIEEHSDEGKSNGEKSIENKQLILIKSNNLIQVSENSQNQDEDQLSNSKLSLKSRFKQAVQKSFRSPSRKSIFTLLISQEFNTFHEQERKSIQSRLEPGNQILATKFISQKKTQWKQKCISKTEIKRQTKYVNIEQFSVSSQAFQRKINQIHGTNSKNAIQIESFSLIPKSSRKSAINIISKLQTNCVLGIQDKKNENIDQQQTLERLTLNEKNEIQKVQINVTVTFDNLEKASYQFNKPKHIYEQNNILNQGISQFQHISPKLTPTVVPLTLSPQINQFQLSSPKKLDYSSSLINSKTNRLSRISISQGVTQEEIIKVDQNHEFKKPGLYFRVYYQNKLYKLAQKSNFKRQNLEEIEQSFKPKFDQLNTNTKIATLYTMISTTEQGIQQRKIANEFKKNKIQFLGIQFSKYQIDSEKFLFHYAEETSQDRTDSSEDSESEISFDKLLESSLSKIKPEINKKHSKKQQNNLENINQQQDQNYFLNDQPTDLKQLSTGSLVLIKKIRQTLFVPLFNQPIINLLESTTKNLLLTCNISSCEKFEMDLIQDQHQFAYYEVNRFQGDSKLSAMIISAIENKYSQILIGRYLSQTRLIDFEHQDPVFQTIILEQQEKLDQQLSSQNQTQQILSKSQNKIQNKDAINDSINKKNQTGKRRKQPSQRYLTKQDSLQVHLPKNWNKKAMQSGELSNTLQQSNQQNSNYFTQTSTVLITKPTQTSQQSVFRVMSQKHIDLNSSQQDMSSSFHSSENEETPQSGQVQKSQQTQQQQQISQLQPQDQINSVRILNSQNEDSCQDSNEQYNVNQIKNNMNCLSMYKNSLRMRTHIKESQRRQKLDQIQQIKLAIYDHNYTEFNDNIQLIPETKLDSTFQHGNTFLIIAAQCGCVEIVHELIKRGADINFQNDDGNTAVHLALAYGHYKIADMLMEAGGSTHIINKKGQNAWGML